jgi:hypothetical protein
LPKEQKAAWSNNRVLLLAFMLGLVLAVDILLGAWTAHVSHQSCVRVASVDKIIQEQGIRGLKTLGTKGGVGFAYYQTHPAELAVARKQLMEQNRDFKPQSCSGIF